MELSKKKKKGASNKTNHDKNKYIMPFFKIFSILCNSPGTWSCSKPTGSGHVPQHSESQLGHSPHRQWRYSELQIVLHGEGHGQ